MFNTNTKIGRLVLVGVVIAMVTASAGVAFAAAPAVDTETTDTSQTSDLTDGGTQAYNATTSSNLSWSADSSASKVVVEQNGTTLFTATPDPYANNSTSGTYYYNVSLVDDGSDYSGLDVDANQNVTLNATFTNNTEVDSPDTTNVSITFANGEEKAWVNADTTKTESTGDGILSSITSFSSNDSTPAAQSEESTTITNNTDTVEVSASSSNLSDALSEATAEKSNGALLLTASANAGGSYLPVFYQSASDALSWLDTDEEAYGVLSEDGSTLTIYNAGALTDESGAQSLDVTVTGNEALGFSNTYSMLRSYDAGVGAAVSQAGRAIDLNGQPEWDEAA